MEVTRTSIFSMQVCVPKEWTDEQAKTFADNENECGTTHGWHIRKEGHELLNGSPERAKCTEYHGHVHITLDS